MRVTAAAKSDVICVWRVAGSSYQQVRIRVTCSYFYILVRLFVRVDGVKIRMRESRIHHREPSTLNINP